MNNMKKEEKYPDDFKGYKKEPDFSLHADPNAWNCNYLCDTCINKLGVWECDIFGTDADEIRDHEFECEFYIKTM